MSEQHRLQKAWEQALHAAYAAGYRYAGAHMLADAVRMPQGVPQQLPDDIDGVVNGLLSRLQAEHNAAVEAMMAAEKAYVAAALPRQQASE